MYTILRHSVWSKTIFAMLRPSVLAPWPSPALSVASSPPLSHTCHWKLAVSTNQAPHLRLKTPATVFRGKLFPYHERNPCSFVCLGFTWGFPGGSVIKSLPANVRDTGLNPGLGKLLWRRKWQPTPEFLPEKSHGQRSLAGYSPGSCRVRRDRRAEHAYIHGLFMGLTFYFKSRHNFGVHELTFWKWRGWNFFNQKCLPCNLYIFKVKAESSMMH